MLEDGLTCLPKLIMASSSASSTSDARRLIQQGAVKVGGGKIDDPGYYLQPVPDTIIQVGKRKIIGIRRGAKVPLLVARTRNGGIISTALRGIFLCFLYN